MSLIFLWREASPSLISDARLKCTLRMPDDLLKCDPDELVFEGPVSESSTCNLTVRNTSPRDVVFKVKTNAPKRYVVTPNEDVIKAREMRIIKISTVAGVESGGESRDRIAVLSAVASDEMPPSLSQFWQLVEKARVSEKFFTCTFPGQDQQPSNIAPTNTVGQLTQEIEKLRKENEELKCQAAMSKLGRETSSQPVVTAAAPSGTLETLRMNVPPIIYLLITFLFALAVGKFML
ncbi:Vesicle-associated membrane protein-associated protein B/C [Taenia crassiceps]|uniref:Vesicle-associated membrane protein-associated protein B/C n=1 Tax=Taenia crassiceps TaxID=6207 RepID=A0ABR4Q2J6_9CEST